MTYAIFANEVTQNTADALDEWAFSGSSAEEYPLSDHEVKLLSLQMERKWIQTNFKRWWP